MGEGPGPTTGRVAALEAVGEGRHPLEARSLRVRPSEFMDVVMDVARAQRWWTLLASLTKCCEEGLCCDRCGDEVVTDGLEVCAVGRLPAIDRPQICAWCRSVHTQVTASMAPAVTMATLLRSGF